MFYFFFFQDDKKANKKHQKLYPVWKQSYQSLKPKTEIKMVATSNVSKPLKQKNLTILPPVNKDRPFSEDNVTHQPEDFHSANKDKFMASISHNRDLSTFRKKINPIQSQGGLITEELRSVKEFSKLEFKGEILDPLQFTEKKGYVEKIRRGLIEAKKFDNPALYDMIKKDNVAAEKLNDSAVNVSLEEIKDEINVVFFLSLKKVYYTIYVLIRLRSSLRINLQAKTMTLKGFRKKTRKAAATRSPQRRKYCSSTTNLR